MVQNPQPQDSLRNETFSSDSTASDLLSAARKMSPEAWEQLVDRYAHLVAHWIRRNGIPDADVPDVLQMVMLRLAVYLPDFEKDGGKGSFRRWLRTVTNSQVAEFLRRNGRHPVAEGGSEALSRMNATPAAAEDGNSAGSHAEKKYTELEGMFAQVEAETNPVTWQAFWRSTVDGRTSTEVAAELGMTPNAVRLAKARVLQRLREIAGDSQ